MNIKLILFYFAAVIIQISFYESTESALSSFPFLDGVPLTSSTVIESKYLMQWYFPIFFILLYFSGSFRKNLVASGIPFLIRNDRKGIWIIRQVMGIFMKTAIFILIQLGVYLLFVRNRPDVSDYSWLLMLYFLSIFCVICFQLILEMYLAPQYSLLLSNVLIITSTLVHTKIATSELNALNYLLIIPQGMGLRNGLAEEDIVQRINLPMVLSIEIALIVFVLIIASCKMKKMDIY
jgi:hypothetical protein